MAEVLFDEWSGEMTLDLGFIQVPEIKAHGRHSIVDGTSRWAVFFKADGPPTVKLNADELVRLRCEHGPWAQAEYLPEGGSQHRIIGAGPAPFPSGAPAEFLLQSDTSQPTPDALAPLLEDAGAIETARHHLDAIREDVDDRLGKELSPLERGLLSGLVVELNELASYIEGHLDGASPPTDHRRSVARALEVLRRAANEWGGSRAAGLAKLAVDIGRFLHVFGITVDFPIG